MTTFQRTPETASQKSASALVRLVMYGRRFACIDQDRARSWLDERGVTYDFVDISADPRAAGLLERWVGSLSVPTLVAARPGEVEPYRPPSPLPPGQRVRGVNRGSLITEPSNEELERWLAQHGLV